ncbi:AbiV family abortive infection protein, partial [Arthrospira platensis SPKY2]
MKYRARLVAVPREEVLRGAELALRNAEIYIRDGKRLLVEPMNLPIANALFTFALEEVGKASVLCEHYKDLHLGRQIDEKMLHSAFTDHKQKTLTALTILEAVFRKVEGEYRTGLGMV